MTEISVIAQEIAASRRRGIPADEGKLWETVRLDAERAGAGEEILRGFLDLVVLRHDSFSSGLGLLLAHKLAEYSIPAERLGEIARAAMAGDPGIITAAIADLVAIRTRDPAAENYLRPFLHFVARISSWAKSALRIDIYLRRTYSGRPSFSIRLSDATAMATSVVCRPSVRERSASPITRL